MLLSGTLMIMGLFGSLEIIQEWDFSNETVAKTWHPNTHLADVALVDGALHARTIDWDPFFTCTDITLPTTPSQCVLIRIKADASGIGQLFWTGQTAGQHGGFSEKKISNFKIADAADYQDIYLFPFWHAEKNICQLRLDLFQGAAFSIERIAILERVGTPPSTDVNSWQLENMPNAQDWKSLNNGSLLAGPPLSIPTEHAGWVSVALISKVDTTIAIEWTTASMLGSHRETIYVQHSGAPRSYYLEMQGNRYWTGQLVGLNLHIPEPEKVEVERIALTTEPDGPPDLEVVYFGFEDGISRMGRPESVLALVRNRGGGKAEIKNPIFEAPSGLEVLSGPTFEGASLLKNGDNVTIRWQVQTERADTFPVSLQLAESAETHKISLPFLPGVEYTAEYVPEPKPIKTAVDICAYYFPGWNSDVKYDCIRNIAPIRKPLLGYYDESNPECVDWQIKWAVENGIHCFLVDWYWVAGNQSLLHWFDAYRTARYRDHLKVAIMWANHNPSGTHSREDWRAVTREWIDNYFSLPSYYQINRKPAIFLWDANLIRSDLGGSDAVAEAFEESQSMARKAGYSGIEFIILQHHANTQHIRQCQEEGYGGNTSYHEFGKALDMAADKSQARYSDVVATAPESWEQRRQLSATLPYYPVVDTGWDSRPWHGDNSMVFHGRSPEHFKRLLLSARDYCAEHKQEILILGPLNEWGEGSYVEPNLEFGFDMYAAIREVFGKGSPGKWPENLSPRDMNLGPYDFPRAPQKVKWYFETDTEGWAAMMNVADLAVTDGVMHFLATSKDPALVTLTPNLRASDYSTLKIRMKVEEAESGDMRGQLFWTHGSNNTSEMASCHFQLQQSDKFHDYTIHLSDNPRWRGKINMIRFDPCNLSGARISIDHIEFN